MTLLLLLIFSSILGFSQETPDSTIILKNQKEYDSVMVLLEKKHIAFSWKIYRCCGGQNYDKKGTGKSIEYRFGSNVIVTRRRGGEIIF